MGQLVTGEECPDRGGIWDEALKEGFGGQFTAGGIAKQQGNKVNYVVEASATTREVDTLTDGVEESALGEVANQDNHLSEPGGMQGLS